MESGKGQNAGMPDVYDLEGDVAMFAVIGLLVAPSLVSAAPQHDLTLQQVAKAHGAMTNAIRSLHVSIRLSHNLTASGKELLPDIQPVYIIEWYKDNAGQRVRQNWLRGKLPHSFDAYNGPKGFKALIDYDPKFTPPLSESIDGPARGDIDKTRRMEEAFMCKPRAVCYLAFPKEGESVTLEEYITAFPNSELAATPATSKFGCYEIKTLEKVGTAGGART